MQRHLEHALALDPNNKSAIQLAKLIDHPSKARVEPLDLPKYSIIVPTHRRANLLDRALSSIKLQICNSNHEVIVVSDCVEAETDEVCRRWLGSSDTYVRRSGVPGPSDSRNLALKLARGKFVLFLDDDDAWHQGLLASLDECQILNSGHPVYFNCSVVKESRKSSKPHRIGEKFLDTSGLLDLNVFVKNQVHMSCFAFPTELVRNLEFDTHMRAYEDWDFLLSVFEQQMPQHHPFLGSAVHEVDDESSDRRGNSQPAQDFNAVIDYLYVYRRHPVSTELQLSRARLLASAGLQLSSDLL
ncbi:MAG: hypothetical protein B7Y59_05030 [Burkholderiales bacterium 35-55-47]|nr:MAG: hypothetical protein B7Y59_05030 [Burkholderiales bacterium 35-55-47]OYZ73302.1 MAG: hypothetical protein B7Y06_07150 [Burkholderiales bacterium 24-55-52]OZA98834.1 MAG: hypothetical protein B7X62_12905 [Burkholderiales bacterium 39-55-53]